MLSLTATELNRFMACNGFKSLNGVEPFNISTDLADEGNAAHWLAEQAHNGVKPEDLIGQQAPNGFFITDEMVDFCKDYIDFITQYDCEIETDTSIQSNKWEIRGRADCIAYLDSTNTLVVADLKYGWRIVEPKLNWTLISHAVGWCIKNNKTPQHITIAIFQPRPFHPEGTYREWCLSYADLGAYYKQLTNVLDNPSATVCTGSQCYKCQCMSQCPAAQIATMNALDVAQSAFNSEIDDDKLSWMLTNLKRAQEILKQSYEAYEDLALHRLTEGKSLKGYSVQQALGNTTWNKDITSDVIQAMCGVDIRVEKLMTPAQAKKAGVPEDLIKFCTNRPDNGLKLVAVDEKKQAEKLFGRRK